MSLKPVSYREIKRKREQVSFVRCDRRFDKRLSVGGGGYLPLLC
jgi:hypothetical protein